MVIEHSLIAVPAVFLRWPKDFHTGDDAMRGSGGCQLVIYRSVSGDPSDESKDEVGGGKGEEGEAEEDKEKEEGGEGCIWHRFLST